MNAGLMCDQGNSAGAIQYFLRILEKQPNKWDQFAQLIPLLRRNGKLEDAEKIMSGTYFKYYKVTDSVTRNKVMVEKLRYLCDLIVTFSQQM